jgi:hypothetical protein
MSMTCWCCLSPEAREGKKISDEIDRILCEDEKHLRKEFKLLLLGRFIYNDSNVHFQFCSGKIMLHIHRYESLSEFPNISQG